MTPIDRCHGGNPGAFVPFAPCCPSTGTECPTLSRATETALRTAWTRFPGARSSATADRRVIRDRIGLPPHVQPDQRAGAVTQPDVADLGGQYVQRRNPLGPDLRDHHVLRHDPQPQGRARRVGNAGQKDRPARPRAPARTARRRTGSVPRSYAGRAAYPETHSRPGAGAAARLCPSRRRTTPFPPRRSGPNPAVTDPKSL